MHSGLSGKKIVIEGDFWFFCFFHSFVNTSMDYNLSSVSSKDDLSSDIFDNKIYCCTFSVLSKEDFSHILKNCIFICSSGKTETKKILKFIEEKNTLVITRENFCEVMCSFLSKRDKEYYGEILSISNSKIMYMKYIDCPEELYDVNSGVKSFNFDLVDKVDFSSEANKLALFSKLKNSKLNFLIHSILKSNNEVACEKIIKDNTKNLFSDKHISYAIKSFSSSKSYTEEFIIYLMIIINRYRYNFSKSWFNIIFVLIGILHNKNNLNNDEKIIVKKTIKYIFNQKQYV